MTNLLRKGGKPVVFAPCTLFSWLLSCDNFPTPVYKLNGKKLSTDGRVQI